MEKRAPENIIRKLDRLIDGGQEPVVVLGMLLKRVVLLMEVKAIMEEHGRRSATGKSLAALMAGPVNPFYADVLRRQALRFEKSELESLLNNLRWADFKIKTSRLEPKHIIEEALLAAHLGKTLAYPGENL
jgi:DNA polymerase III delta subunit